MILKRFHVLLFSLLVGLTAAAGDHPYDLENRTQFLDLTLQALKETPPQLLSDLRNFMHAIDRNQCRSAYADLRATCLLDAARRNCRQKRGGAKAQENCRLVSDVVVSNQLGEKAFIDTRKKFDIMREHSDYREEMLKELHRHYARLVLEFGLSSHFPEPGQSLGAGIDQYCRSSAYARQISWQYCVSAIVWFISNPVTPDKLGS